MRKPRGHLRTLDSTPNTLAGRTWWGHTQPGPRTKASTPGGVGVSTQALSRSGSGRKLVHTQQTGLQEPPGEYQRSEVERPPLTQQKAEAKG